jgi:flagellar biosynthetic protein FliR
MFVVGVEIAGPIIGAMFLTEMAFGMLVRAAPTMNILMVGFPVKIFITFALLGIALPLVLGHLDGVVTAIVHSMNEVARFLSG